MSSYKSASKRCPETFHFTPSNTTSLKVALDPETRTKALDSRRRTSRNICRVSRGSILQRRFGNLITNSQGAPESFRDARKRIHRGQNSLGNVCVHTHTRTLGNFGESELDQFSCHRGNIRHKTIREFDIVTSNATAAIVPRVRASETSQIRPRRHSIIWELRLDIPVSQLRR